MKPRQKKTAKSAQNRRFDQKKEVRAIARERVGSVKASHPITPKTSRKKPKHKKPPESNEWENG
jgi:hypothetical protein